MFTAQLVSSPDIAPSTRRVTAGGSCHATFGTALLLGNYRPTVTVARSLSRIGYRVMVGLGGGEGCTEYSRFVAESWDHPELDAPENEFQSALLALIAARPDITVIYPVAEEFVRYFSERELKLPGHVVLASPRSSVVRTCCDKLAMLQVLERAGVNHLPYRVVTSWKSLPIAAQEIGYPLVIRPLNGVTRLGHKKALIVSDQDELDRLVAVSPDGQFSLLLQRYADGERQDIFFAALDGRILRAMQVRYFRTDHIDGTGLCVYGEVQSLDPELVKYCQTLARTLDYTGIGCAQFVVDGAKISFLEINPRISALHCVPEAMGMDLSSVAIELACGKLPKKLREKFRYEPGRRFAWTYGDIRGIKSAFRNREISFSRAVSRLVSVVWTAIRADLHLTWRWDDPLPTARLFLRQLTLGKL